MLSLFFVIHIDILYYGQTSCNQTTIHIILPGRDRGSPAVNLSVFPGKREGHLQAHGVCT